MSAVRSPFVVAGGTTETDSLIPALGRDWLTVLYDPVVRLTTRERVFKQRLLDTADLPERGHVLDVGCGTGTLAISAKRARPELRVVGLDADPKILGIARRKMERAGCAVELVQGVSSDLPCPDGHFHRVVSSLFFHHLRTATKRRTMAEVFRVLEPGGEFHIADWGEPSNRLMRALFTSIQLLDGSETTRDNVLGFLPHFLEQAGFEDVARRDRLATVYGTLELYSARKPG